METLTADKKRDIKSVFLRSKLSRCSQCHGIFSKYSFQVLDGMRAEGRSEKEIDTFSMTLCYCGLWREQYLNRKYS
jgi:hypothetical protein